MEVLGNSRNDFPRNTLADWGTRSIDRSRSRSVIDRGKSVCELFQGSYVIVSTASRSDQFEGRQSVRNNELGFQMEVDDLCATFRVRASVVAVTKPNMQIIGNNQYLA
jgi:hypothetical protein